MDKHIKMKANQEKKKKRKAALEKLSNKMLVIFTTGLLAEVVLLYLYSFSRNSSMANGVQTFIGIFTILSVAALITFFVLAKKTDDAERKSKFKNWGWFSVACAVVSLVISSRALTKWIFFFSESAQQAVNSFKSKITFGLGDTKLILGTMIAVAVYLVVALIVITVKSHKIKKQ